MQKGWMIFGLFLSLSLTHTWARADDAVTMRLQAYEKEAGPDFSASRGQALWGRNIDHATGVKQRSCARCHGADVSQPGKHLRTGKRIEPLSPSVNPSALSDEKKIEKWFRRNCKWTLGRECTAREKGDVLKFLITGEGQ